MRIDSAHWATAIADYLPPTSLPLISGGPRNALSALAAWSEPPPSVGVSVPSLLVVGPEPSHSGALEPFADCVAALITRLGFQPALLRTARTAEILAHCTRESPEAVILALDSETVVSRGVVDLSPPWEAWVLVTRQLRAIGTTVLAAGVRASVASVAACVRAGAVGVLGVEQLTDELEDLDSVFTNKASKGKVAVYRGGTAATGWLPQPYDGLVHLTRGEERVLYRMMQGASAHEMAQDFMVSITTIRTHIRKILQKLGASSQLAAVALANGHRPRALDRP